MGLTKKLLLLPLMTLPIIFNSIPNEKIKENGIKKYQEKIFEEKFDTELNVEGYKRKDIGKTKMMVPKV